MKVPRICLECKRRSSRSIFFCTGSGIHQGSRWTQRGGLYLSARMLRLGLRITLCERACPVSKPGSVQRRSNHPHPHSLVFVEGAIFCWLWWRFTPSASKTSERSRREHSVVFSLCI